MFKGNIVPSTPPLETATSLSGGQIIVVVLAGLLFGLAFQLLLANFGIAIGLSVFNLKPNPQNSDEQSENGDPGFDPIALIGVAAGLAIMVSIDGVLFVACFLAVKLSQVNGPGLGAILGGLIWAVYLILLTWLSTSAVGTVADTVLGFTRTGLRQLFGAVGQLFSSDSSEANPIEEDSRSTEITKQQLLQMVEEIDFTPVLEHAQARLKPKPSGQSDFSQIAEQVIANAKQSELDLGQVIDELQDQLQLPQPLLEQIQQQIQAFEPEGSDSLKSVAEPQTLQSDQTSDLKNFLKTADPADLQPESLSAKLAPFETSQSSQTWPIVENLDFKGLLRTALRRVDLSDWDVQRIWQLLQSTQKKLSGSSQPEQPVNVIRLDVEDYLLNTPAWDLKSEMIDVDFKEIIYDPEADPALVHQQLTLLTPEQMRTLLQERGDMSLDHQADIADALDRVRLNVLEQVQPTSALDGTQQEQLNQLQQKLESYCRYTTLSRLSPEGIEQKLQTLLEETQIPFSEGEQSLDLDLKPLQEILKRRKGLKPKQQKALLTAVTESWQGRLPKPIQLLPAAPAIQKRLKAILAEQVRGKDGDLVTLEDLKPHLIQLIEQPASGLTVLNQYFGQLDWLSLAQELQGEPDLNPQHLESVLTKLREEWQQVAKVPRRWARRTRRTAQDWQHQLQRYLKYQDRSALIGIKSLEKDLRHLLAEARDGLPIPQGEHKQSGSLNLPKQPEIIALLQERKDLAAHEIEQVSSQLVATWDKLVDETQALPGRTQSSLDKLASKVREVLNSLSNSAPDPAELQETLSDALPDVELAQILQSLAQKAPTELLKESSWQQIRDRISVLTQSTYQQLIHTRDDLEDTVKHQLSQQAEALQQQLLDQVDQLQTELQQQAQELKQDTQRQADKVRQSAAIAAWWLFAITLTSGMTSALSGYLAVRGLR
ncbi:MFS transporter [Acaryochloris sp. CCMEE 5410]|uniref:MFS transporter n=1 Tax=Acaryochloris sp. CCMEE 5410 TaxID=310037 RepID=UPI00031DCFA8|nr:MFS transporter [Acaryochloris sp. CCMEE 5410]KAI9132830.1 hypothetical protein ON05_005395 [Acaryochloris sp. CCMEE 5410]